MSSETLKHIVMHIPPAQLSKPYTDFPFSVETFCIENDAKLTELRNALIKCRYFCNSQKIIIETVDAALDGVK